MKQMKAIRRNVEVSYFKSFTSNINCCKLRFARTLFKPEAYLRPYQQSGMEFFVAKKLLKVLSPYFRKKASSYIFDRVMNMPLETMLLDQKKSLS